MRYILYALKDVLPHKLTERLLLLECHLLFPHQISQESRSTSGQLRYTESVPALPKCSMALQDRLGLRRMLAMLDPEHGFLVPDGRRRGPMSSMK